MKPLRLARCAFFAAALTQCLPSRAHRSGTLASADAPLNAKATLNDLSILLPFAQDSAFIDRTLRPDDQPDPATIAPDEPALAVDGAAFLPSDTVVALDDALGLPPGVSAPVKPRPFTASLSGDAGMQLRLTALRFDPCFNILATKGDDAACRAQMRLIWQGYDQAKQPVDANIHEVFSLSRDDFRASLRTLLKLQQDSGLDYTAAPLGPQPAMISQGVEGAYFKGVLGLVHRYARSANLAAVAGLIRMTGASGATEWRMATVTKVAGRLQPTPLIAVASDGAKATPLFQSFNFVQLVGASGASPGPASPDAFAPAQGPGGLSSFAEIGAYLTKIDRITNPTLHDVTDTDCSSCHEASRAMWSVGRFAVPASDPGSAFTASGNLNHDLIFSANNADPGNLFPILQMFSYRGPFAGKLVPVVQVRVINETALAVDYANAHSLQ